MVPTKYSEFDRAQIPIRDNSELLIYLPDFLSQHNSTIQLQVGATYGAQNLDNYKLREQSAKRLLQAEQLVLKESQNKFTLQLTDTYRPLSLQRKYFNEIRDRFNQQGLRGSELYNKVTEVISDPDLCAPHTTGGTVDLTLYDITKQQAVDMGSEIDDVENELRYLWHPKVSSIVLRYRKLLFNAMRSAGFAEAEEEWWHYSYGDQQWAIIYKQPHAIYGSI